MLRKLLVLGWLFGVPATLIGYHCHTFLYGLTLNVGPETADRIRPGMTLVEVVAIVGGPPGDYRYDGRNTFAQISGCCWDHQIEWLTDRGRLVVVDGASGLCCRNSADGLVDSVRWVAAERNEGVRQFVTLVAIYFAWTFGTFAFVRLFLITHRQSFPPAPATTGNSLRLPNYPA